MLPAPPELGGKTIVELIRDGVVKVTIDEKFPQALGITSILERTQLLGNFDWDILLNEYTESPFFTSDFPTAIEASSDPRIMNRVVPLAPDIAIRIRPDLDPVRGAGGVKFPHFKGRWFRAGREEIVHINRLIVRCAEELVFFREDRDWTEKFVKKNAVFRIEPEVFRIPAPRGELQWCTLRIKPTDS